MPRWLISTTIGLEVCLLTASTSAANALSVRDLADLVAASEDKYQSWDIQYTQRDYDGPPEQGGMPKTEALVTTRYASGRSLTQVEAWRVTKGARQGLLRWQVDVTTPTWQKHVIKSEQDYRATIRAPTKRIAKQTVDLWKRIWDFFGVPWGKLAEDPTAAARYDADKQLWRLERWRDDGTTKAVWVAFVDPGKDYFPVRYELWKNGTLVICEQASDFHRVDGLWMPGTLSYFTPIGPRAQTQFMAILSLTQTRVNQPIAPSDLDYVLPAGTLVDDQIAGCVYTVGLLSDGKKVLDEDKVLDPVMDSITTTPSPLMLEGKLQEPARDDELEGAYRRSQSQLLSAASPPGPTARRNAITGTVAVVIVAAAGGILLIIRTRRLRKQ